MTASNPEADLNAFFDKVDVWISSIGFVKTKVDIDKITEILNLDGEQIALMNSEELLNSTYSLYGYIDSLQASVNREKSILDYCEESIWRIISPIFNDYGDKFTKWEYKYNSAIRENPLAYKINVLKITTKARMTMIEHRLEHVKKRTDILLEIVRRKKNENYN